MKRCVKHYSLLTVLLSLSLTACGESGKSKNLSSTFPQGAFTIIDASPMPNDEQVPKESSILVMFNESIDPATVPGGVKVSQTQNGALVDLTSQMLTSVSSTRINNDTVTLTPQTSLLASNSTYTVTVTPALHSATGHSFQYSYRFSTGYLNNIGGGVTVPGPPQVTGWHQYTYSQMGGCLSVGVDFNEDLIDAPRVSYEVKDIVGFLISSGYMYVNGAPNGGMRSFVLDFLDGGCGANGYVNPDYLALTTKIKITVNEGFDLDGEGLSPTSKTFSGWNF